jgi:hypothetical protein
MTAISAVILNVFMYVYRDCAGFCRIQIDPINGSEHS